MSIIKSSSSSSSSLPEDLMFETLLYQPVETLLRFKSVSKSWLALIESSEFIHRHAAITTDKLGTCFIFQSSTHVSLNNLVSWNLFTITEEFQVLQNLGMPPCYKYPRGWRDDLFMVGSCNGVICLQDDNHRDISLWNPAIHQFRLLPKSLTCTVGKVYKDLIAFGFDVKTKDYKVVLVSFFHPWINQVSPKYPYRVQVYSLSSNSWRPLDEDLFMPSHPLAGGGYLNGSHYCLGWKWSNNTCKDEQWPLMKEVLSFDFTKENFNTLPLPDGINYMSEPRIMFLGGKIGIIDRYMSRNTYDFWVLNEAELAVKESWTKLYTIGPYETNPRLIGVSNDGEFIFMVTSNGEKLWLLNTCTRVMKEIQCDVNQKIMTANVYRSSLVPVSSTRNGVDV